MSWIYYILITLATFLLMECVAWLTHKYVMHGWLWFLHEDHHVKSPGFFEKNDTFFLIFAIPSMLLFLFGTLKDMAWMICIGAGIAMYGAAYFLVHDIIIHQRFRLFTRSSNRYVKVVRWAHKMHHKHLDKEDGESFGMLIVAAKYWKKVNNDFNRNRAEKQER